MDTDQKEWFATAMVAIVLADGKVSQGEVEGLMNSISFVQDPNAVERLKKYIQFQTPPPLSVFTGWEKEVRNKGAILLDLMDVAVSDSDLSPPEKAKFYELGNLLGFNKGKIDELIEAGNRFMQNPG